MIIKFLIFFVYTFIFSLLMHRYFVIRAERYKIKKVNTSAERWSSQSKPILGGITFYATFIFAIFNYSFFFGIDNLLNAQIFGTIVVITMAFLMGLADDMLNTPPGFKFIFQFLSGIILIYTGIFINIFDNNWLNYLLTIFWVVGIMNSVNMLDNMDAITTSVSSTILLGAIFILYITQPFSGVFLFIAIGGLAGLLSFLYYNWNPSKMYMGDNGSQFLGALLAIIGIQVFWNGVEMPDHSTLYPFLIVFMAFIIPITDTTTVTVNRLLRKQSPFVGGRDHTTHHLSYLGLHEKTIARLLLSINLIFVAFSIFIILFPQKIFFPVWIIGILALFVMILLYVNTKISKPEK